MSYKTTEFFRKLVLVLTGIIITTFMIPSYQYSTAWNMQCTLDFMVFMFGCYIVSCLKLDKLIKEDVEIMEIYLCTLLAMAMIFICKTNSADKWIIPEAQFFFQELNVFVLGATVYAILVYENRQLEDKSLFFSNIGVAIGCFCISYCSFMEFTVQNPIFLLNIIWAINLIPMMFLSFRDKEESDDDEKQDILQ